MSVFSKCALVAGVVASLSMSVSALPTFSTYLVSQSLLSPYGAAMGEGLQIDFSGTNAIQTYIDANINVADGGTYDGTTDSYMYGGYFVGGDDFAVAFKNDRTTAVNSVTLSGLGNGGGLFYFDGDDDYGSSNITTSSADGITGTVTFVGGLQPGQFAWLDFECSPNSLNVPDPVVQTPEPGMLSMMFVGLLSLAGFAVSRKRK